MDEATFKLLTSFIVKGRRFAGSIDSDRLVKDAEYARGVFRKIEDEGDEDVVLLALKLREALSTRGGTAAEPGKEPRDEKYKYGVRS